MKHSIKLRFTLIFAAIIAVLLGMHYLATTLFLQDYYRNRKIKILKAAYETIDQMVVLAEENDETLLELINDEYGKDVTDSPVIGVIRALNERSNIDVVMSNDDNSMTAVTSREGDWDLRKLNIYIAYRELFGGDADAELPGFFVPDSGHRIKSDKPVISEFSGGEDGAAPPPMPVEDDAGEADAGDASGLGEAETDAFKPGTNRPAADTQDTDGTDETAGTGSAGTKLPPAAPEEGGAAPGDGGTAPGGEGTAPGDDGTAPGNDGSEQGEEMQIGQPAQKWVAESDESPIKLIEVADNYTIQMFSDTRSDTSYLECWGTFSDGSTNFLMTMPLASIEEGVNVSNRFILISMIVVLIVGSIAVYFAASRMTRPINELAMISKRMSMLDFGAKYEGRAKDEIGLLGDSMNQMSDTLEQTIEELKKANEQLQADIDVKIKIDDMRKEFIANVSHELKTPIALIEGYAEGLTEGLAEDPESRDYYCNVIMDEAQKMNKLVKQLTSLINYEFGDNTLDRTVFNLSDLVRSVTEAQKLRIEEAGASVELNLPDEAPVNADEFKIEEAFTNYLNNAINHVDGEKRIIVGITPQKATCGTVSGLNSAGNGSAAATPGATNLHGGANGADVWKLTVYNDGEHIPEESLDRIWEKFYKVDRSRSRQYGGSGIGLSIVKAIMDSHGGTCSVANVDGGVEFAFTLQQASE